MADPRSQELRKAAEGLRLRSVADTSPTVGPELSAIQDSAFKFAEAWSGSNLGQLAEHARREVDSAKAVAASVLSTYLAERDDKYLAELAGTIAKIEPLTRANAIRVQLPTGALMSRDTTALTAGLVAAPHQEVLARVASIRSAFGSASELAGLLDRAADHLERASKKGWSARSRQGGSVFIGHGRSPLWRELKDFIQDRLKLSWDEFNRVPVAGVTNTERLIQMLDDAGIAFLVLTAEDERTDGAMLARQNVIHEAGLFQGRLGFSRAIVMLEEGCKEFSNIAGLGQIRFPVGKISASFEEVRRVLEREGFELGSPS